MINSILNRDKNQAKLNRIILQKPEPTVITNPSTILSLTKQHYQEQTKTSFQNINDYPQWLQEHSPITTIKESWYTEILQDITTTEIKSTIKKMSSESVPGKSGINYAIYKHIGPKALQTLTKIFSKILHTGDIPNKWQYNLLYPIPKKYNWENNLNLTRPITLLETSKKIFTKIINNRLAKTLTSHPILSPLNWAGLPQGNTKEPINIINNILEDAREFHKECWILSQDMSKAFDSIDPKMLTLALKRIKIPGKILNIVNNIISNRNNQIITAHGLTESYQPQGGIDQGDTISPLLWRIYYDPLITKISKDYTSYTIKSELTSPLNSEQNCQKINLPILAFMDDTTWISNNQQELQQITSTAETFYELNNLKTNPDKSTLITTNHSHNNPKQIILSNQIIKAKHKHEPIRFLGTWISASNSKTYQKDLIKNKIIQTTQTLSHKYITDKQCRYIINHVLLPSIEYLLQDLVLTDAECIQLNSIIIKTFKHKINLPITAINSAIHMHTGYKIFHIYD